jgi:hypothetical protein
MKSLITGSIVALALGVTAAAQDSTVKTQTKVSGDDARAVTMRGCLQQTSGDPGFLLLGAVKASGEDLEAKTKVKTDVDDDDTTVKSKTATKIDKSDDTVGTSGAAVTYAVSPRQGVDLATHAGEEVEITAVMVDARDGGDKDADVKIREKTKVDNDDAPDAKVQSTTKAELPRGAANRLMAMSVKSLGRSCSGN